MGALADVYWVGIILGGEVGVCMKECDGLKIYACDVRAGDYAYKV